MPLSGDVAIVIPARNESDRIGATVTAAVQLPGADLVVVVDDGSHDGTARIAEQAGAVVVRHARGRGKAAAMRTGAEAVARIESGDEAPGNGRGAPRHLLFLDADLAGTAGAAEPLIEPVRSGRADVTIAVFRDRVRRGGHGFVVRLSGAGIERATGWRPTQPLNGQRCLTRAAFTAALPLAAGFGVETGMTIDLLRQGLRVAEVEVPMAHRATGRDWHSQLHRARQFAEIAWAVAARHPVRRARVSARPEPGASRPASG
jgi:glycosyltransferase involved in cell wall biosynthesis